MGKKYDKEFMSTGKEVNQIADALRNRNKPSDPNGGKKKKKILIIMNIIRFHHVYIMVK